MSFNCRGLLTQFYGPILAQDQPLISTPETPMPHPLEKPTSLNLLLSLTSSLPLLSENSILGRSFRTHAFLSCSGGAETLKGISLREFNYTLGVGFVGKMWEVSHRNYWGKFLTGFMYTYCRLVDLSWITASPWVAMWNLDLGFHLEQSFSSSRTSSSGYNYSCPSNPTCAKLFD